MFLPDVNLKDLILNSLKTEEQSISKLSRQLKKEGYKLHRLVLTGYLKAMADLNVLKEKEIPPSKVYSTSAYREKNLYELVGEKCNSLEVAESEKIKIAIYTLQKLFHRPIFLREIKQLNLKGPIELEKITGEERSLAKEVFNKCGYQIPTNEPAYLITENYQDDFIVLISDMIIDKFSMRNLTAETKQLKLPIDKT